MAEVPAPVQNTDEQGGKSEPSTEKTGSDAPPSEPDSTANPKVEETATPTTEQDRNTVSTEPPPAENSQPATPTEVTDTNQEPKHDSPQTTPEGQTATNEIKQEPEDVSKPVGQIVDGETAEPVQEGSEPQTQPSEVDNEVKPAVSSISGDSDPSGAPKQGEEATPIKVEKQPAIGQLQLKELLSGTSIQIVEHAQKLAEAPLIGTIKEEPPVSVPSHAAPQIPNIVVGSDIQSSAPVLTAEDQYPGPDHDDLPFVHRHPSFPNTIAASEDESQDTEPYDVYTVPEGAEKVDECPTILKRYVQLYNDDKQPVARYFKLEDEDRLNEAAGWDIQASYQSKPTCFIRSSVLEKVLRGVLEFRLSRYVAEGLDPKRTKQLLPILSEDVATTLAQCRFYSYKYSYFVSIIPKNRQDVVISTRQIWDRTTDRRVIAKMDNRKFHASVIVHFMFHP
ncbi:uncharacterized protein LOC129590111 [Paramacrobiotus metropolitanus]|uniref:uncharacterized protein LOC129590111 n=1 Tax=Paramacrobiotus metropolitanus TaxID=2943436 RepID=UPI00244565FB|nr:uncharacterized protein LOC129590111 [Paramacrobiotus metropolitanus]XP_055341102.1 uncharacterized protein LOC129590111 [Paramacrobiotus metropolitanus]